MTATETHRSIDAVWRIESAKLIAGLTRIVGDIGLAEDLAQDALVVALEKWPESGVPDNPGAWLMGTAKHRAIDHFRRDKLLERKPKSWVASWRTRNQPRPISTPLSTTTWATTSFAWSSCHAIRSCRPKRESGLPCDSSVA